MRARIAGTPKGTWPPTAGGMAVRVRDATGAKLWTTAPDLSDVTIDGEAWGGVPRSSYIRIYTASDTWTKPSGSSFQQARIIAVSGGGGGGGAGTANQKGGGGGGGAAAYKLIVAASLGATETVTVGALGAGGAAGDNNGAAGGTSSFGAHVSCTGGSGGNASNGAVASAAGGTASSGDLNYNGRKGGPPGATTTDGKGHGGAAGGAYLDGGITLPNVTDTFPVGGLIGQWAGGGGVSYFADTTTNAAGNPGGHYGGGGAGGTDDTATRAGGDGGPGVVVVIEEYSGSSGAGGVSAHALLDGGAAHSDSVIQTVSRGSLVYGNSTPKWDELVIGAANRLLHSDGTDPSWAQVALAADVSGVLPEANGGTDQSAYAQGDLLYASAADTLAKLAITVPAAGLISLLGAVAGNTVPSYQTFGQRARIRHSAAQSIANSTQVVIEAMDTEDFDTDTMHYTSNAALTGTVTKTAGSATLAGSGTSFTTELSVGQVISVPGTAAERRVVTAIASNISLTVSATFANTAAGQTATRISGSLTIRTAGTYLLVGQGRFATNTTGFRGLFINVYTGATKNYVAFSRVAPSSDRTDMVVATIWVCAQWDYAILETIQTSGGALDFDVSAPGVPSLAAWRLPS